MLCYSTQSWLFQACIYSDMPKFSNTPLIVHSSQIVLFNTGIYNSSNNTIVKLKEKAKGKFAQ